jgi:effector-binding domain-containing protein
VTGTAAEEPEDVLPFLRGPLPERFRRLHVRLEPGVPRAYVEGEWRDALVVVEQGRLDLECHRGGVCSFPPGAVLHLQGLALRALRGGPGPAPTVLTAVLRRNPVEPRTVELPDRPYRGVRATCTRATMAVVADRIPEIIGEVVAAGAVLAGAPFIRYHRLGPDGEVDAEAGVPVDDPALATGALPAGRYAVTRHTGHLDGLDAATDALLRWAAERGLAWDRTDAGDGELWVCRAEHFLTDPTQQPDPALFETELCFRLADG